LLFGSHPQSWIERARIRVIKYQGIGEATGVNLNIVKDLFFEGSLINQLDESARAIESLLREFTKLDSKTGKFITVPEYPPSAWREMLVNAIAHREYALTGADIQIKIFDDRLEVISPGNFPSTVREDNIRDTHFSRNPKIARVLGDLGYVRELGEGVNRIFDEMAAANLPNPIFKNPSGSVVVTLKNDIAKRELRKHADLLRQIPKELFDSLEEEERIIVFYVLENGKITKKDATTLIKRSTSTVLGILKRLQQKSPPILITVRSSPQDPNAHYILNPEIAPASPQPPATSKSIQGNLFWPKKD
jgi:ATP-dependent DNA helicase RecG